MIERYDTIDRIDTVDTEPTRILYIEDELIQARLVQKRLEEVDYEVDIAANAAEGLTLYEQKRYDLVAVDYKIPDQDGLDLIETLTGRDPDLPVIMITGEGNEQVAVKAMKMGAKDYIVKDVRGKYIEIAVTVIERVLRQQKQAIAMRKIERDYREMFDKMLNGFALHEILCDADGLPYDYRFLDVNPAFEQLTGLKREDIVGKTAREVLPETEPYWIEIYGRVALTGKPVQFENHSGKLDRYYDIRAYSPRPGQFATVFADMTERRKAEEALKDSEARFRRLAENAEDIIYRYRLKPERGFEYINEAATTITGYTPEDHYADPDLGFKLIHPDDHGILEELASAGSSETTILRWVRKDGEVVWIDHRIVPIYDEDGDLVALEGIARDISERKQAEEDLRQSEAKFRHLIEQSANGIVVTDNKGRIVEWNEAHEGLTGLSREEVLGRPLWEVMFGLAVPERRTPQNYERLKAMFAGVYEKKDLSRLKKPAEAELQRPDGTRRTIQSQVFPVLTGEDFMIASINRDITAQKEAEKALQESERRYRTLLESITEGVYALDREWRYTLINDTAAQLVRMPKEDLLGQKLSERFPGIEHTEFFAVYRRVMETREPESITHEYTFEDGRQGWYEVRVYPVPEGILCIATDISERRQAELDLRIKDSALESAINGIAMADLSGRLTYANPALLEMWGYDGVDEMLDRPVADFWHSQELVEAMLAELSETGGWVGEGTGVRRDGSLFDAQITASIVKNGDRKPICILASFLDITKQKRAEETVRRQAEIEAALAGLSEDLLSPVTTGDVSIQVLQQAQHLTGSEIGYVGHIDPETGYLVASTMDQTVRDECQTEDQSYVFEEFRGLWGWVLNHHQPLVCNAPATDSRASGVPEGHVPIHRVLCVPAMIGGELVGQICVANPGRDYTEDDLQLLQRLAMIYALALQRQRIEESLREALDMSHRRGVETEALLKAAQAVLEKTTFAEAAQAIFDVAKEVTGATSGYVALLSDDGAENEVLFLDSGGRPCDVDPYLPMPIRGLRAESYRDRKVVYDNRFASSEWIQFMPEGHMRLDNVLFAPLVISGQAVGLIGIANKPGGFNDNDARMVGALGELAAVALQNSRALEALSASEAKFRTLFNNTNDAMFIHDLEGHFLEVNRVACDRLGYSREELLRMGPQDIDSPEYASFVLERTQQMIRDGQAMFETAHVSRDGRVIPVELSARVIDYQGKPAILSLARDITVRKQMEDQFIEAQRMDTVGRLAGGIAHQFNNLLTGLAGYAHFVKSALPPDDPSYEDIEQVIQTSDKLADLTRRLLAFSRRQIMQPKKMNLSLLVLDMEEMFAHLLNDKIEQVVSLDPDLWPVKADPRHIEQVLVNMIINAQEAMPWGGMLNIETANVSLKVEDVEDYRDLSPGDYVMLAISDTGTGMSAETLSHIFEPFFTTRGMAEATGLGLSAAYGIIKQHGGDLRVYSEVGKGSRFEIYLPRFKEDGEQASPAEDLTHE